MCYSIYGVAVNKTRTVRGFHAMNKFLLWVSRIGLVMILLGGLRLPGSVAESIFGVQQGWTLLQIDVLGFVFLGFAIFFFSAGPIRKLEELLPERNSVPAVARNTDSTQESKM